jgi:hypothetical protein
MLIWLSKDVCVTELSKVVSRGELLVVFNEVGVHCCVTDLAKQSLWAILISLLRGHYIVNNQLEEKTGDRVFGCLSE